MKHIKKILMMLTSAAIVAFSGITSVYAADPACKVYDLDDSITDSEEKVLNEKISKQADKLGFNIAVVITDDLGSDSKGYMSDFQEEVVAQDFADNYYDNLFGDYSDGILLLINNEFYFDIISTSGSLINEYDPYIEQFLDDVQPKLKSGDYYEAIDIFVRRADAKTYKFAGTFAPFLIGAAIAAVISLIVCLIIAWKYKTHQKYEPKNYNAGNQLNFREKSDRFIREYTTKTKIESSSGGSRSGSSGGYHGSSSHHGGGGRHR